jgi:hypothetical protein
VKITPRTPWAALALLALVGCVQAPRQQYFWGTFPRQQYEALLREGASAEGQIQAMEAQSERARASSAALPPGFRAHLGLLHLSLGNADAARSMWLAEKAAFPEAAGYMDSLIMRLDKSAAPKPAGKENPA